jgi:hypothetical protein
MKEPARWIEIALLAFCYGGAALLWTTKKRKAGRIIPVCSYMDAIFWALYGFQFALLVTYGWQAFHKPLILFLLVLAFVGTMVTGFLKPARRSQEDLQ